MSVSGSSGPRPLITLEEHFLSRSVEPGLFKAIVSRPKIEDKAFDLSHIRLADMDASSITMQFISHCASFSGKRDCIAINNDIAAAVKAYPNRFAGLASLPMSEPAAAAEELRRCIRGLGISGAMIDNHFNGKYYEAYEYDVFWSMAQELDSPIYLHPTLATNSMKESYDGSYSPAAAVSMSMDAFGWHYDTATHITRLYAAGVFDRFPKLKIVLGHFGESPPFWKQRIAA